MKSVIFALLVGLICGCASSGKNFDSRKITEIKKGETTEADLIKMFGAPSQRVVNSESGVMLVWLYVQATVKGATFIPIVGSFAGGMNTKNKTLTAMMNPDGTVASYNYSGGGLDTIGMTSRDPEHGTITNSPTSLKSPRAQ